MNLLGFIGFILAVGLLAWLAERLDNRLPRWTALAGLVVALAWLTGVWLGADGPIRAATELPWIPRFGIAVILSMDGLSLLLVALTLFLGVVAVAASWTEIREQQGFFQFNLLATLAGVVGVFTALDLFLFFLFWEVMLIPMYFLIVIWGHEDRAYSGMKFFLFTQISGLLMLLAIVALVFVNHAETGIVTFDYRALLGAPIPAEIGFWIMLGFFIAFVVKLPGVPFHTWLPDAHTQAPTAGSVLLAGIMLKTGAYGLIRFVVPLFPDAAFAFRWPAMILGAISVVYGGYLAFSQTDFKRLVAYSSVSHMGFVLLGVFAWNQLALQGSVIQMLAHGFSSAALFMLAGALQQRLHSREMTDMGGLWMRAPRMGAMALFFVVASLGMPGLGTFVGEFLILLGAFQVNVPVTVAAAIGIVIAAVYALSLMQRAFQGPPNESVARLADFGGREMTVMLLMAAGLVWLGLYPQPLLDMAAPTIELLMVSGP
jgi:NADH-quinone oxidoreductase subunit M